MVGGNILNYKKLASEGNNLVVEIDVIGTGCESKDTRKVKGVMPKPAYELLEIGNSIWWECKTLFINLLGVPDCKFEKIGNSY